MIQHRTTILPALVALASTAILWGCSTSHKDLHKEVNPWIGTGGHGHTYPGATTPFGMVQLSPDTRLEGWDGCGGYHDTDSLIYGFSHTHLQGTGVSDYGDVLVMPCTQYRDGATWRDKYKSGFQKSTEHGHAGFYEVTLKDHNIHAELTSTPRVGIHRYTLNEPDTLTWIVDLDHRDDLVHYSIEPRGTRMLVGHRVSKNWAEEQHVYFAMAFDRDFEWGDQLGEITHLDTLDDGTLVQEMTMVPVFVADFGVLDELNVHVALSFCDIEGAIRNLEAEVQGFDFDAHRAACEALWDEQLGRIQIDGGRPDDRTTFYTALYHATTVPNLANDVDGRYRGTDLNVHQLEESEGNHYTVFSLWDTYRALHPLLAWIEPNRTRDMVRTMLRMYREGGQLPVWELAANYTGCMIGYHSVPVIVDAEQWRIDGWDHDLALEAMVQAADSMHLGLDAYAELGYIPSDHEHESVSKTLEYAFDDACISRYARSHGRPELAQRFGRRASSWKNLVNSGSGFIQAKRQGAWVEGFDPREVNFNFTEANGWQYLFAPAHDVAGQKDILGGDEGYLNRLNALFTAPIQTTGRIQPDITGLIGQYAHGNEPSHHVAYLASYAGNPGATAERVTTICRDMYANAPDGLCGNEDCGQMSAWFVWSALGMYPVEPGSGEVVLGSPMFKRTVIRPEGALEATEIRARGLSDAAKYITGLRWHDAQGTSSPVLKRAFVPVSDLTQGGLLELLMASKPNALFGQAPEDRPTSAWKAEGFVTVPGITAPRTFQEASTSFNLDHVDSTATLEWSVDDGLEWNLYEGPVEVEQTTNVLARAIQGNDTSVVVSHRMLKIDHNWQLTLAFPPDNQYSAGGSQALIDGLTGGADYRTGEWQGFWGKDCVATIDLGEVERIERIELRALHEIKPWIWSPRRVLFSASEDGSDFDVVAIVNTSVAEDDAEIQIERFICDEAFDTRYVQIEAQGHGPIPEWHLGRGNDRWMFLDEVVLELGQ
jgi:predicted alpha-1,2-mannosidase